MGENFIPTIKKLSVATITMQLLKKGLRNSSMQGVKPLNKPTKNIVGPAYTLRFIPAREDLSTPEIVGRDGYIPRIAIEEVPRDAVLVIDGRGASNIAVLGDILIERLKIRGVAGLVTDGGIRDLETSLLSDFAIYAAGAAAPASISGHASGDLQCPIGCGGIAVLPGDLIVGDSDGVAVIPKSFVKNVALDGLEQERFERFAKLKIKGGSQVIGTYPPSDQILSLYQDWIRAGEPDY